MLSNRPVAPLSPLLVPQHPFYGVAFIGIRPALAFLKAERDENTCRKAQTPEEDYDQARLIAEALRPAAQEAKLTGKSSDGNGGGRGKKKPSGDSPEGFSSTRQGRETNTQAANAVGMGRQRYERAGKVATRLETFRRKLDEAIKSKDDQRIHRFKTIPARVFKAETPDHWLEYFEIAENLHRQELTLEEKQLQSTRLLRWTAENYRGGHDNPIHEKSTSTGRPKGLVQEVATVAGVNHSTIRAHVKAAANTAGLSINPATATVEELKKVEEAARALVQPAAWSSGLPNQAPRIWCKDTWSVQFPGSKTTPICAGNVRRSRVKGQGLHLRPPGYSSARDRPQAWRACVVLCLTAQRRYNPAVAKGNGLCSCSWMNQAMPPSPARSCTSRLRPLLSDPKRRGT